MYDARGFMRNYEKQALLNCLIKEDALGVLTRLRVKGLSTSETCCKDFLNFEKTTKSNRSLLSLRSSDGQVIEDNAQLKCFIRDFYKNVFTTKKSNERAMSDFTQNLPQL